MADIDRLLKVVLDRQWRKILVIVAANTIAVCCLIGAFMLVILLTLHGLDFLGIIPCFCAVSTRGDLESR